MDEESKKNEQKSFREYFRKNHLAMFYIGSISMIIAVAVDTVDCLDVKLLLYLNLFTCLLVCIIFVLGITKVINMYISLGTSIYCVIVSTFAYDAYFMNINKNFTQLLLRDLFVVVALMFLCSVGVSRIHATYISIITCVFITLMAFSSKNAFLINAFPLVIIVFLAMGSGVNYFIKLFEKSAYEILQSREIAIEKNKKLEQMNEMLELQKKELIEAQNQLIQSEKMAVLGQLISGVAHEINTPLGAIKASINNITEYLQNTLEQKIPELFKNLNEDELELFFKLLKKSMENQLIISSKEKRAYKKSMALLLDEIGLENSRSIADSFTDMGIYNGIEPYFPLLKNKNSTLIIQTCYEISGIIRNSENIKIAVERASKIIFALKSYSYKDNSGEKVDASIIEGIETVLALYNHHIKQGTEIVRNYAEIPKIKCYPDELNQVWTNIISNALQAMEYKGTIEIDVYRDSENLIVKITDSGPGIPDEIKSKIFEPFFTTKPQGEGTGLGLDIINKIIMKHNGYIYVESVPGRTSFIVKLPIK
jgi:signal transduction histidine kinase